MCKFSIIVPVYKVEDYLSKCIDSILGQSFSDFELILIDDGSPDNCPILCDQYAALDSRVKVIHKKNGGVSSARNIGISLSKGEYMLFIDSDDYIVHDSLKTINDVMNMNRADIYFFNTLREGSCLSTIEDFFNKHYVTYEVGFGPWNKIYKTSIIKKNSLFFDESETIGEDLLFNMSYYAAIFSDGKGNICFSKQKYYVYVDRPGSAMNTASNTRIVNQLRLYEKENAIFEHMLCSKSRVYLFWLHFISGIQQSLQGGLTAKQFLNMIDLKKYRMEIEGFTHIRRNFFKNEHASILGKCRITLFAGMLRLKCYYLAALIMGMK